VNPLRLAVAEELGATPVDAGAGSLDEAGVLPDVLLECSGNAPATVAALGVLAPRGRAVLVGMGGETLPLPLSVLQNRELTITGCFRYANTWPTAIALVTSGAVDLDRLVTARFGLDDVEAALTAARRDPATVKVVVRPGPTGGRPA
jgi:L-iditol 2-dehydrogenase